MLSRFWLQNITCKCIFNINGCISTSALTTYLIYTIANHINYRINNGFLREAIYEYSDVRRCRGHREYLQIGHKEPDPHRTGQELTTKVREETLRLSILNSRWEPVEERTKGERGALSHLGGWTFHEAKRQRMNVSKNVTCIPVLCLPVWLLLVTLDSKYSKLNGYCGYSHVLDTELNSLHMLSYLISLDIHVNVWNGIISTLSDKVGS